MTRIEASTLPQRGVVHTSSGRNSPQTPRPLSPRNDAYNSDVMGIIAELAGKWKYFAPGGLVVEELHFKVPLNHNAPAGEKILLFARSVKRRSSSVKPGSGKPLPWLLYLQGGPGGASPRPQDTAWVGPILDKGYQVWLCIPLFPFLSFFVLSTLFMHFHMSAVVIYDFPPGCYS